MTVISIVFIHTEDKRIFLWMAQAGSQEEAMLRAQQEFDGMGIDPEKLAIVAIKCLETNEMAIQKSKEIGDYEQWKKSGKKDS